MKRILLAAGFLSFAHAATLTDGAANPAKAGMDAERLARIPARMKAFVDQGTAAGFVTLVARHGTLAQLAAVGYQDREAKTPMKTDSIFQIMSMTKPITSTGIMILVDEGRLALTDPVEKHLPEFRGQKLASGAKPARVITVRDLLTHTSGIAAAPSGFNAKRERSLADMALVVSQLPLQFEPGTKWSYSNSGMATLGRIIEVISGQSYEAFISDRIFAPLRMKDTHFFLPESKHSRLATPYTDDHGTLKRADGDPFRTGAKYPGPEGGLYSTAADLASFYQMMLNKGTLDGHRILPKAAVEVMTRVHTGDLTTGFAPGIGYGLGWGIIRNTEGMFRLGSIGSYGHGGAYRTYAQVDPARDMFTVLLYQRTNGGGDMADEITAFLTMAAAAVAE